MNKHAHLLAQLLPPVSYDPAAPNLAAQLAAEGAALDAAQASAERLVSVQPWLFGDADFLPDWERLYQIQPAAGATDAQRQAVILARINATGGLSLAYIKTVLTLAGYQVVLDEPREFRAGAGCAGDCIYIEGAVDFYWRVRVKNVSDADVSTLSAWLSDIQPAGAHFTIEVL